MENTMDGAARRDEGAARGGEGAARGGERSAVQNTISAGSKLKLVLLWLAVCIPMVWGVMKALEDVRKLLP